MKGLRSLLLEDLEITAPGMTVLRLCLNRHLPETNWVRSHRHPFSQILLYLSGYGWQVVKDEKIPVSSGRVIGIPAGTEHSFVKEKARSPLCLVIDLETEASMFSGVESRILNLEGMTEIQRCLTWLARERKTDSPLRIREAGIVLQVTGLLAEVLTAQVWSKLPTGKAASSRYVEKVRSILRSSNPENWEGEAIAEAMEMSRERLNRLLKRDCGLTLGQLVSEHRLVKARECLEGTEREIQEVGMEVGILDRNYFARWFRRQTGLTPTAWRERHRQGVNDGA